jgi:hypothetical protein
MIKFFQWLVVCVPDELLAPEVLIEEVHAPHSGRGIQQEFFS